MHSILATVTHKRFLKENVNHVELPQGFCFIEREDDLKDSYECAVVETDYFGGGGSQCSSFIKQRKFGEREEVFYDDINDALTKIGVVREDSDEFDAINLGHYRSNEDIWNRDEYETYFEDRDILESIHHALKELPKGHTFQI
jgi:hypothetical protein